MPPASPLFPPSTRLSIIGLIFALLAPMALARAPQGPAGTPSVTPQLVEMETTRFEHLRQAGFAAVYNLDYSSARHRFTEMTAAYPAHPAGSLYQATVIWLEILNRRGRLRTNLFTGTSFFNDKPDRATPETDRRFRTLISAAIARANEATDRHPDDTTALYYKGQAQGLLASYEGTVNRAFFSALRNGLAAVKLHREVLKRDPSFVDAHLTTGTYNYIVGSLPLLVKILATIGGIRGSREEGIRELERVARDGRLARDDARVALLTFYARERRYDKACAVARQLAERYPHNYIFRLETAGFLVYLKRYSESNRLFDDMLADPNMSPVAGMVHFQYGEALLAENRYALALDQFRQVTRLTATSPELITRAWLRTGQMMDLAGRREAAKAAYRQVLQRPEVFDSHEEATRFMKRPFTLD